MSKMGSRHGRIPPQIPAAIFVLGLAVTGVIVWAKNAKGDPTRLVVSGVIEGESVNLGSKVGGRLKRLDVAEGSQVEPGQIIAAFDVPELHAQREQLLAARAEAFAVLDKLKNGPRGVDVAQAKASVDSARAAYAELAAGSRDEDIAAAEAAWKQAEVSYELAAADFRRTSQLFDQSVIARNQLDAAQAKVEAARQAAAGARQQMDKVRSGPRDTQLDVAAAQVRLAQAGYAAVAAGSRPEDISAGEARLASIEAQISQLEVRLAEAEVLSGSAGVVTAVFHQPGDLIQPNSPVLEILLDGSYYVQVFVPANKLSWAAPGTACRVELDTYPGETFQGKISYLARSGEFTPRNLQTKEKRVEEVFRCKVKLDAGGHELRTGMVCDVVLGRPAAGSPQ